MINEQLLYHILVLDKIENIKNIFIALRNKSLKYNHICLVHNKFFFCCLPLFPAQQYQLTYFNSFCHYIFANVDILLLIDYLHIILSIVLVTQVPLKI